MGMNLKVILFLMALAGTVRTATPSFGDFALNQFETNANKVRIRSNALLTNPIVAAGVITGNGSGLTNISGLITNQFTTNVVGVAILGDVSFSRNLSGSNVNSGYLRVTNIIVFGGGSGGVSLEQAASRLLISNSVVLANGAIIGDGSGLTNLQVLTTNNFFINNVTNNNIHVTNNAFFNFVTVTNHAVFNGKVTLNSNVYVCSLLWFTNVMSTITINASKAFEFLATNNNISITGYSNIDGTNANAFTRVFTNTAGSAAVKSITLPVGSLMLSSPWTNVVYLTNQGILSGVIYPGAGTNVSWTGN